MKRVALFILLSGLVGLAESPTRQRVLFNRYLVPAMTVYIADADGKNERALVPTKGLEHSPS